MKEANYKFGFLFLVGMLFISGFALAQVDLDLPYHFLQEISKSSTNLASVDLDGNLIIDEVEFAYDAGSIGGSTLVEITDIVDQGIDVGGSTVCDGEMKTLTLPYNSLTEEGYFETDFRKSCGVSEACELILERSHVTAPDNWREVDQQYLAIGDFATSKDNVITFYDDSDAELVDRPIEGCTDTYYSPCERKYYLNDLSLGSNYRIKYRNLCGEEIPVSNFPVDCKGREVLVATHNYQSWHSSSMKKIYFGMPHICRGPTCHLYLINSDNQVVSELKYFSWSDYYNRWFSPSTGAKSSATIFKDGSRAVVSYVLSEDLSKGGDRDKIFTLTDGTKDGLNISLYACDIRDVGDYFAKTEIYSSFGAHSYDMFENKNPLEKGILQSCGNGDQCRVAVESYTSGVDGIKFRGDAEKDYRLYWKSGSRCGLDFSGFSTSSYKVTSTVGSYNSVTGLCTASMFVQDKSDTRSYVFNMYKVPDNL